jgi:hypothetical protein
MSTTGVALVILAAWLIVALVVADVLLARSVFQIVDRAVALRNREDFLRTVHYICLDCEAKHGLNRSDRALRLHTQEPLPCCECRNETVEGVWYHRPPSDFRCLGRGLAHDRA